MKKLIIIIIGLIAFSPFLFSQVPPFEPPSDSMTMWGNSDFRGTLNIRDLPIITSTTYTIMADANGQLGYYGVAPTISCNIGSTVVEMGTENAITVTGTAVNSIGATLTEIGIWDVNDGRNTIYALTGLNYTQLMSLSFDPTPTGYSTNTYTTQLDWTLGSNSGTATCAKSINAPYPILYGISTNDYSTNAAGMYSDLTKLVEVEGDKSVIMTGTGYLYYAIPQVWSDTTLSLIEDPNGFPNTANFTTVHALYITSTTTNVWVIQYIIYIYDDYLYGADWGVKTWTFNR